MTGYLIQLMGDMIEELYWTPIKIKDNIIKASYANWVLEDTNEEFEDWWNRDHPNLLIERVFVEEIYV